MSVTEMWILCVGGHQNGIFFLVFSNRFVYNIHLVSVYSHFHLTQFCVRTSGFEMSNVLLIAFESFVKLILMVSILFGLYNTKNGNVHATDGIKLNRIGNIV